MYLADHKENQITEMQQFLDAIKSLNAAEKEKVDAATAVVFDVVYELARESKRLGEPETLNRVIDVLGDKIAEIKNSGGWTLAHDLAAYGDSRVHNRIIDMFGERIAEIKNSGGWTLAHVLVKHGDSGVQNRIIDLLGERIAEIKDHDDWTLAHDLALEGRGEDGVVQNRIIDMFGERIAEIKDHDDWTLAHGLIMYRGSNRVQNRIIDIFGERIAEIKNHDGWTLAHALAGYGDSGVQNRIIDIFGDRIAEIKNSGGWTLAHVMVRCEDIGIHNRIIDLLGERIAEIKSSDGWTVAHDLVRHGDIGIHNRIIDLLGERIAEIKSSGGLTLAHDLVRRGDIGIHNRIIDLLGERIAEIKDYDGWTIAYYMTEHNYYELAPRILLVAGKINKNEEEFTKRMLSNLDGSGGNEFFDLLLKHKKRSDLSLIEDYFIEHAELNDIAKGRLIEAMGKGTDVERIIAVRGIFYSITHGGIEDLESIVATGSGKMLKHIGMLPTIGDFYRFGLINKNEKTGIFKSEDMGAVLGRLLVGKVEKSLGVVIMNEVAKDAIAQKPNFVTDLIRFNLLYSKVPNAHMVLTNAMNAYFKRGTNGFKDFKFHGHELADRQLGMDGAGLITFKEKLCGLDMLSSVALQKTGSKAAESLKTDILNYNAHRDELKEEAYRIRNEAEESLNSLALRASKELREMIERKDIEGMKKQDLGEEEHMKRKAIALFLEYGAVDAIGNAEALINRINKDENTQDLREMLREDDKGMAENIIDSLNMLKKRMKKSEPGSAMLPLENLISIVSYLNKPILEDKRAIRASFTFDPSEILTFGRYGSSGAGNCQNSNAVNAGLNQSLMSMLADANQLMIRFTSPSDGDTLGFAQVHILQSDKGAILLLENPYTNQPNRSETMRKAAESLVVSAANELGIEAYAKSNKGERITVTIPKSYVNRYIDFLGKRIHSNEEKVPVKMRRLVDDVVISIRK